jgi:hypothetical protein
MCELTREPTARIVSSKTCTLAPRLLSKRRRGSEGGGPLLSLSALRFPPPPPARSGEELPSSAAAPLLAQATVPSSLSDSPSISAVVIASILVSAIPPWESDPEQESGLRSSRGKACSR